MPTPPRPSPLRPHAAPSNWGERAYANLQPPCFHPLNPVWPSTGQLQFPIPFSPSLCYTGSMRPPPYATTIRSVPYTITFAPHRTTDGTATLPALPSSDRWGRVSIDSGLTPRQTLTTLVHELLHATQPDLDEAVVTQSARDIARILWHLGFRYTDPDLR